MLTNHLLEDFRLNTNPKKVFPNNTPKKESTPKR